MIQWKYAWLSVSGASKAFAAFFVYKALQVLKSPTSVEALLLTGIAFYAPLEICIYQRIPSLAKTVVMLLVVLLSTIQARLTLEDKEYEGFDLPGRRYAVLAAFLSSASDVWIELADPRNDEHAENLRVL